MAGGRKGRDPGDYMASYSNSYAYHAGSGEDELSTKPTTVEPLNLDHMPGEQAAAVVMAWFCMRYGKEGEISIPKFEIDRILKTWEGDNGRFGVLASYNQDTGNYDLAIRGPSVPFKKLDDLPSDDITDRIADCMEEENE